MKDGGNKNGEEGVELEALGENAKKKKEEWRNSFDWSSDEEEVDDEEEVEDGDSEGSELGLGKYFGEDGVGIRWW